eukprot:11180231-Lingulodinium_polyedra.AAC.1
MYGMVVFGMNKEEQQIARAQVLRQQGTSGVCIARPRVGALVDETAVAAVRPFIVWRRSLGCS